MKDPAEMTPEQRTPRGETIPVPKRQEVFRDLRKVAKADRSKLDTSAGSADKK